MSSQEKEDYKKALIEIVEGYRFGRFPDAIKIAEKTLKKYGFILNAKGVEDKNKNITVKIGGKPFYCNCGCNVFHHPDNNLNLYKCNACENIYIGG